MTEYNDWIIWNGGGCPVPLGTMGQVQFASQSRKVALRKPAAGLCAYQWNLDPEDYGSAIIAYRTVREPEVVREKLQIHQYGGRFVYSFDHVMYADAPRWSGHIVFEVGPDGNPTNVRIEGLRDD